MISQELKQKALELRQSGKSYDFISKELGLSTSILSYWFSKEEWSKKVYTKNKLANLQESKLRILKLNKLRSVKLLEKYKQVEEEATAQFEEYKNQPLFVGALMLYLGEGDKSAIGHATRIGNIDYSVLKIFIKFIVKYCDTPIENIYFWLLCYPDLDAKVCEAWWMDKLGMSKENLYKTQVIQGKHKTKRLRFGVGNIIIPKKTLKIKILKWIDLMSEELMRA